jgi:hypothetical protein
VTVHHIKAAVKSLWREKWINLLCTLSIATGLFLIAIAVLGIYNLERATRKLPERFSLTVYLKDGLTTDEVQYVMKEIKKSPAVKTVDYTSKDDALKDLKSSMRNSEYILEGLDENPLPASMAVGLNRASVTDMSVGKLAGNIEALKGVAEVEYGKKLLGVIGEEEFGAARRFTDKRPCGGDNIRLLQHGKDTLLQEDAGGRDVKTSRSHKVVHPDAVSHGGRAHRARRRSH